MVKYAMNLEEELNTAVAQGVTKNDDIMSVDSSDAADDTDDVEIVEPNGGGLAAADDLSNYRPLEFFDHIFYLNFG